MEADTLIIDHDQHGGTVELCARGEVFRGNWESVGGATRVRFNGYDKIRRDVDIPEDVSDRDRTFFWRKLYIQLGANLAEAVLMTAYGEAGALWGSHLDIRISGPFANEIRLGLGGVREDLVQLDTERPEWKVDRVLELLARLGFDDVAVDPKAWGIVISTPPANLTLNARILREALRDRGVDLQAADGAATETTRILVGEFDAATDAARLLLFNVDDEALDVGAAILKASATVTEQLQAERTAKLSAPLVNGKTLEELGAEEAKRRAGRLTRRVWQDSRGWHWTIHEGDTLKAAGWFEGDDPMHERRAQMRAEDWPFVKDIAYSAERRGLAPTEVSGG